MSIIPKSFKLQTLVFMLEYFCTNLMKERH